MAFDFPNSPSVGTVYTSPVGTAYTWDGEKWTSGTGYGAIYINDNPPTAPVGSLWWESDTGILYVNYYDGNSTQWVAISGGIFDAVRYGAAQTLTTNQRAQARANIDVTKKNYIINGAMMISQENGSAVTANSGYPVDQFITSWNNPATHSVQQIALATPGGSPNRLRATPTSGPGSIGASDYFMFYTKMEGLRTADLLLGTSLAKTITIQFGCRSSQAGTFSIGIRNGANNRSYFTTYTISAGEVNTDIVRAVTIAMDTTGTWPVDNTASVQVFWATYAGSTYITPTPNAWVAGSFIAAAAGTNIPNGGTFDLFDVSLTEGSAAPPFMVPDYASELAACRRYYYRFNAVSGAANSFGYLQAWSTTAAFGKVLDLPVEMRAIPVGSMSSVNHIAAYTANSGAFNSFGTGALNDNSLKHVGTTSFGGTIGLVAGNAAAIGFNNTGGWIAANARL